MWDKSYMVFTENDALELASMFKLAVEEGFAYQGAQTLNLDPVEIRRLYDKVARFVQAPRSLEQIHLDQWINKPGSPRLPTKHSWGTEPA